MEKSSFKYWFAHWAAFQMTAINLGVWKPRFLFHDWEKPWLRLFLPYEKVQKIHRKFSRHHMDSPRKKDYLATAIDWECSRYTKLNNQMTVQQYYNHFCENNRWQCDYDKEKMLITLIKLGL